MFLEFFKFLAAFLLVVNCSLWSSQSAALNLGEIELVSELGEPLRATIQVVEDNLSDSSFFSADLYLSEKLGNKSSEEQLFLNSLSFQFADDVVGVNNLLIITSPEIFQQPELDFFVKITAADKSVLVRVTLLFLAKSSAAVAQIVELTSDIFSHEVIVGDTLWNISASFSSNNVSIWQAMDGVFITNPDAFLEGDPSKIIIGSYLNRPSESQIERQSGFVVANQLGLEVYGETTSNTAIVDRPAVMEGSLESLDVSYSSQEIPYFKVTDSIVVNDSVDMIADYDGGDPMIEVEVADNLLGKGLSSNLKPASAEPIGDPRPTDGELIYEQHTVAKAQAEISDLRTVIVSLNSEIKNLQNRVQLQKAEGDRAAAQAELDAKSGYLSGQVNVAQLIAFALVLLGGSALLIYMAVKRRSSVPDITNVSSQESHDVVDGGLVSSDMIPTQDSSGSEIFDGTNPEPEDVFAIENTPDGEIENSFSNIESIEFDAELDPENSINLDYLDMTENIDPVDVKLDLAETYADLGDIAGAREILEEIINESNKEGKRRARAVLEKLDSDPLS